MITVDLRVAASAWQSTISDLTSICQRAFEAGAAVGAVNGDISLLLTDDREMQALNKAWRYKDKPTDVLSFPADTHDRPFLGDIAVGFGVSRNDADARGINLSQHLSHLLIHGYFHLLGYDHQADVEAAEMEKMEATALASLGWPDPYM